MSRIKNRMEEVRATTSLIAILIFIACGLTFKFFPNKLTDVAMLCIVPICLMLGWYIGLMDARKNA